MVYTCIYIYDISLKLTVFSNNPTCSALSTKPWSSLGSRDGETARTSTRRTSICHHLASKQQTFLAKQFFNFSISWSQDFLPWLGFSFNLVWFSNDYVHNSYRSGTRLTSSKIKNPPHRSEKCHPHAKSQGFSALMNRICRWNSSYYLNRSPARWRWGGALGIWSRLATSPDRFFDTGMIQVIEEMTWNVSFFFKTLYLRQSMMIWVIWSIWLFPLNQAFRSHIPTEEAQEAAPKIPSKHVQASLIYDHICRYL